MIHVQSQKYMKDQENFMDSLWYLISSWSQATSYMLYAIFRKIKWLISFGTGVFENRFGKVKLNLHDYIQQKGMAYLTHWGQVTHICVRKLTTIGSDNGLSPGRRQAIIWTNAGILLIGPPGTNFSGIFIEIHTFSLKEMHLKICEMAAILSRPQCVNHNCIFWQNESCF